MPSPEPTAGPSRTYAVLELTVNNHPGVMSHVCGLFSRRTFNVEGILCLPVGGGERSRVWLRVADDERAEQLIRQLCKLRDVLDVRRHQAGHEVFLRLEAFFRGEQHAAGMP
jgi:acetolactate synthase-1/3 small subunit